MDFIHSDFMGGPEHVAMVTLDGQANVMLMDHQCFEAYRTGGPFEYRGGWATRSPVKLAPPHYGRWHVVVDLGGKLGSVRVGLRVLKTSAQGRVC